MTTNRVLSAVSFLACLGALVAPSSASAQCQPDDIFCAELRIGPGTPPPPPPPVVVQPPPPPPVIVQPPPPPVVVQPPPPPVVIVAPQQPPPPPPRQIVVVAPPRREPAVVAVQVQRRRVTRYELVPAFDFGVHLALSGMALADDSGMAGFSGGFRLRPIEHIGIDLTIGAFGGQSWLYGNGDGGDRWEVPVVADVLFFFNPQHRVQFYALVGVGASYAVQQFTSTGNERDFGYVGGEAGLGLEFRIGRHFALNLDVRGFVRQQVQDDDGPEFTRRTESGSLQSTDTSGGVYGNVGMTFYFGG